MTPPKTVGYSSTPLWRKLGIKNAGPFRVVLRGAPADFEIPDLAASVSLTREPAKTKGIAQVDVLVAFYRDAKSLQRDLASLAPRIFPDGALWLSWPRRQGGHISDITDHVAREAALALGLVDVKVAALSEDWSGLRFVWRKERRGDP